MHMSDSIDGTVLAIDGGGTRCRFALDGRCGRQVVEGGPANVYSDFDGAVAGILAGIETLARACDLPVARLHALPAFVGIAGVMNEANARHLASALPLTTARYAADRLAALRGALGSQNGYVAHCGTGSFFAATVDGTPRFAGGWGAALADEASAQWVGRKALAAAIQAVDGFRAQTPLLASLLEQMGGSAGIMNFTVSATPETYGALAPQVTQHARSGDAAARQILQEGADYLANGINRMGWRDQPICLTGGIGPLYEPYLPPEQQAVLAAPLATPLDGAIALARDHAKEAAHGHC